MSMYKGMVVTTTAPPPPSSFSKTDSPISTTTYSTVGTGTGGSSMGHGGGKQRFKRRSIGGNPSYSSTNSYHSHYSHTSNDSNNVNNHDSATSGLSSHLPRRYSHNDLAAHARQEEEAEAEAISSLSFPSSSHSIQWKQTLPKLSIPRQDAACCTIELPPRRLARSHHRSSNLRPQQQKREAIIVVGGRNHHQSNSNGRNSHGDNYKTTTETALNSCEMLEWNIQRKWWKLPNLQTARCGCAIAYTLIEVADDTNTKSISNVRSKPRANSLSHRANSKTAAAATTPPPTTMVDGRLYVFGGLNGNADQPLDDIEVYSFVTKKWRTLTSIKSKLLAPRWYGTAIDIEIESNKSNTESKNDMKQKFILLLGGRNRYWEELDSCDLFNCQTESWVGQEDSSTSSIPLPPCMSTRRFGCAAVKVDRNLLLQRRRHGRRPRRQLQSNQDDVNNESINGFHQGDAILAIGGFTGTEWTQACEWYNPYDNTWNNDVDAGTDIAPMPIAVQFCSATVIRSSKGKDKDKKNDNTDNTDNSIVSAATSAAGTAQSGKEENDDGDDVDEFVLVWGQPATTETILDDDEEGATTTSNNAGNISSSSAVVIQCYSVKRDEWIVLSPSSPTSSTFSMLSNSSPEGFSSRPLINKNSSSIGTSYNRPAGINDDVMMKKHAVGACFGSVANNRLYVLGGSSCGDTQDDNDNDDEDMEATNACHKSSKVDISFLQSLFKSTQGTDEQEQEGEGQEQLTKMQMLQRQQELEQQPEQPQPQAPAIIISPARRTKRLGAVNLGSVGFPNQYHPYHQQGNSINATNNVPDNSGVDNTDHSESLHEEDDIYGKADGNAETERYRDYFSNDQADNEDDGSIKHPLFTSFTARRPSQNGMMSSSSLSFHMPPRNNSGGDSSASVTNHTSKSFSTVSTKSLHSNKKSTAAGADGQAPIDPNTAGDAPAGRTKSSSKQRKRRVQNETMLDNYGVEVLYTGRLTEGGRPHGKGKMSWKLTGDVYQGTFEHGARHGKGRMEYSNGDAFEGRFKNDQREGKGKYFYKDGRRYDGLYVDDMAEDSNGRMTWKDGTYYVGQFTKSKRTGHGIIQFVRPQNVTYSGEFLNGKYHGYGTCAFADGSVYKGEWKHGKAHGQGSLTNPEGIVVHDGKWDNDGPVF